ncbi:MAG: carboxy terminal-processing peptidase [Flavobacteriaceae bacterium]|nr:carboxy terminal-processing peptidase [Flavobacteriaceae bacterium]
MNRNFKFLIPIIVLVLTLVSFTQKDNNEKDKVLIRILRNVLTNGHYEPKQINDTFSIVVFEDFIKNLDPAKRYFLQSDIDEFSKYKTEIDDQILKQEVAFFNLVYNRFLQRVDEAKAYYKEILKSPYDFTINEVLNLNYDNKSYAKSKEEIYSIWKKQLKYSTLSRLYEKINNTSSGLNIPKFEKQFRLNILKENFNFRNIYSSSSEIKEVQKILNKNNISVGRSDGIYGNMTRLGIEKFKSKIKPKDISAEEFAQLEIDARESTIKNYDDFYEYMKDFKHTEWFATYLNSITTAFDPHTSYFAPKSKKEFDESISGKLEGIGARLFKKNDYIKISELISGGPAWRAGELEVGDLILKVAQGDGEPLDVVGMRLSKAIEFIKGPKGTEVRLTLKKIDGSIKVISIIRDIVELQETFVKSSITVKDGKKFGVINLPKFYVDFSDRKARNSATDMAIEIERLKKENIDGILIDLRNNGGGSLPSVIKMAGLFIKDGPIVQVKYKGEKPIVRKDRDKSILWDGPLVVLTNELSASASEIFAAAMQDYKRAVVIGSKQTYGKGTVQNVLDLNKYFKSSDDLGGMALTIQKFYRINGGSTQLEGVKPDIILPSRYTYMNIGEQDYDNPLPWDKIKKANYSQWNNYSNFDDVVHNSIKRINKNPQFLLIDENAKWLKKGQDDTTIYLNYDAYKNDLEKHSKESEQFKKLSKYETNLTFNSPLYELSLIEKDTLLGSKRVSWHKNLAKDVYIEEGLNVLGDLKLSSQKYQLVKD